MADNRSGVEAPIGEGHLDLPTAEGGRDDVVVGDDVALRVVDDAGAGAARGCALRLNGHDGGRHGGGNVRPIRPGAVRGGHGGHRSPVEVRGRGRAQHRRARVEHGTEGQTDRQKHRAEEGDPTRALLRHDDGGRREGIRRGRGRVSTVGLAGWGGVCAAGRGGFLGRHGGFLGRHGGGRRCSGGSLRRGGRNRANGRRGYRRGGGHLARGILRDRKLLSGRVVLSRRALRVAGGRGRLSVARRVGIVGRNMRLSHGFLWCQFVICPPVWAVSSKGH